MTPDQNEYDGLMIKIFEAISLDHPEAMKSLLEGILNSLMRMEREKAIQAKPYERNPERQGYANGFKSRTFNTRMGSLDIHIPQVRGTCLLPSMPGKGLPVGKSVKNCNC